MAHLQKHNISDLTNHAIDGLAEGYLRIHNNAISSAPITGTVPDGTNVKDILSWQMNGTSGGWSASSLTQMIAGQTTPAAGQVIKANGSGGLQFGSGMPEGSYSKSDIMAWSADGTSGGWAVKSLTKAITGTDVAPEGGKVVSSDGDGGLIFASIPSPVPQGEVENDVLHWSEGAWQVQGIDELRSDMGFATPSEANEVLFAWNDGAELVWGSETLQALMTDVFAAGNLPDGGILRVNSGNLEIARDNRMARTASAAGTTPVASDVASWAVDDFGFVTGTGGQLYFVRKTGANAIKSVELC